MEGFEDKGSGVEAEGVEPGDMYEGVGVNEERGKSRGRE